MLRNAFKQTLAALGLELRRLPTDKRAQTASRLSRDETRQLEADLQVFARTHSDVPYWANPRNARDYLTDKRLLFFHELIDLCLARGIRFEDSRVADVGSGTGYLLRLLGQRFKNVRLEGFDPDSDITTLARWLCPEATFYDTANMQTKAKGATVLFCTEVLEHLVDPEVALRSLLGLVDGTGWLVLTVPDGRTDTFPPGPLRNAGDAYVGHINFWSPESWQLFIRRAAVDHAVECGQLSTGENVAFVSGVGKSLE